MPLTTFTKDPDAVLDYKIDWAAWLGDDTITSSTWITPDGITKDSDTHDDTTATVWLSGGTLRRQYGVTNRITTAGGRTEDRTLVIWINDR